MELTIGELVIASYKTGTYIGRLCELRSPKAVVEVLAVVQHPEQGNLHHPHQTEGIFFHQRRALAFQEKALMMIDFLVPYADGEVPDYRKSLEKALEEEVLRMQKLWLQPELQKWSLRAQEELTLLRREYGF